MTESNPNEKRCHTSSSTILRRVVLPLFLLLAFALTWAKNYGVVFDTNSSSSTVRQKSGQKSSATTKAWHKQAAVGNATEMAMLLIHGSSKPTKKDAQRQQFKKRFVFLTHYHKTGHDISKQYRKAVEEIVGARAAQSFNILSSDEWEVEFYKKRKHDETTRCPLPEDPNKTKRRRERRPKKNIYNSNDESLPTTSNNNNNSTTFLKVLHSPDLFCNLQTNHVFSEDTIKEFQKIHGDNNDGAYDHDDNDEQVVINFVHFIRDPFDMAVSNYLYHSQSPTPESWVIESPRTSKPCDPCVLDRNMLKLFLAAADDDDATTETTTKAKTTTTTTTNEPVVTELWVRNVEETCKALMRRKENNKVAYYKNYYEALRSLPAIDGLRLATIHLTMGGSNSGSDILRLAHNTIRLREWEEEQKKRQQQQQKNQPQTTSEPKFVLTLLTNPDWFDSNYPGTLDKLTHFVLGGDDEDDDDLHYFAKTVRETALTRRDEVLKKRKNHFTSGTISSEDRLDLLRSLQTDELLGPLLRDVQSIVRDAWCGDPRNIQQQQGKGNDTKRCVYPHTFEQTTNSN